METKKIYSISAEFRSQQNTIKEKLIHSILSYFLNWVDVTLNRNHSSSSLILHPQNSLVLPRMYSSPKKRVRFDSIHSQNPLYLSTSANKLPQTLTKSMIVIEELLTRKFNRFIFSNTTAWQKKFEIFMLVHYCCRDSYCTLFPRKLA